MSDSLSNFFAKHPFWAIMVIVFMVLPIIGAITHIVLKALGRKGIDNTAPDQNSVNTDIPSKDEKDDTPDVPLDSKG